MRDGYEGCLGAIILFVCGFLLGLSMAGATVSQIEQQAIERGYAVHDSATGEWRWREPTIADAVQAACERIETKGN